MNKYWVLGITILCLLMVSGVFADVTVKQTTTITTMGNSTGMDETTFIKADKSCTKSEAKEGAQAMPGMQKLNLNTITRLDKDVVWIVDPEEGSYKEFSLAQMKEASTEGRSGTMGTFDWKTSVEDLGTQEIDGYKATGLKGIAVGTNREDANQKVRVTYTVWTAKDVPGVDELGKYLGMSIAKTGRDNFIKKDIVNRMYTQVGPAFNDILDKLMSMEGFPVKSEMSLEMSAKDRKQTDQQKEKMKEMMGSPDAEGWVPVTHYLSEVTAISTDPIDDSEFELPKDVKEQK